MEKDILKEISEQNDKIASDLKSQVKEGLDSLNKDFASFKEANEKRLKELKEKGTESVDIKEKMDKIQDALDAKEKKLEELVLSMKRAEGESDKKNQELSETESNHKKHFLNYLRKGNTPEFVQANAEYISLAKKTGLISDDQSAGFLAPASLERGIREVRYDTGEMGKICDVSMISGWAAEFIVEDSDDIDCEWTGENTGFNDQDTKKINKVNVPVHTLKSKISVSIQSIQDTVFDIEGYYKRKTADRFMRKEEEAFVKGDGVEKPRGLITYPETAANDHSGVEAINGGTADDISADDILNLETQLKVFYRKGARFACNRFTLREIRKLKDSSNRYLYEHDKSFEKGSLLASLIGYPISILEDLDGPNAAGTFVTGNKVLYFGNFKQAYAIRERTGYILTRDAITQPDIIKLYTLKRCGGGLVAGDAMKALKIT